MSGALRRLSLWFGLLGAGVALLTCFMTFFSVVLRALFQWPIPGDVELTQMGIALAISLCLPWCQSERAHILVDFFTQRSRESTVRRLDAIGSLALALMYALLAWRTSAGALAVREAGETTMIISLPVWWVYAALAPGLALSALLAGMQALQLGRQAPAGDAA